MSTEPDFTTPDFTTPDFTTPDFTTPDFTKTTSAEATAPSRASRRKFLSLLAGSAAAVGTGGYLLAGQPERWPTPDGLAKVAGSGATESGTTQVAGSVSATPSSVPARALPVGCPGVRRNLVIIEFQGGNDGLATLVPYGNGRLNDLRPGLATPPEDLVILDDDYGLHPALAGLQTQGGLAILQGVGTPDPNGSHFDMERRWWAGVTEGNELPGTGFLGRLCDELEEDAPLTGLTIGATTTPFLLSAKAGTMGLREPDSAWFLSEEEKWFRNLRQAMRAMGASSDTMAGSEGSMAPAREGISRALEFANVLEEFRRQDEADSDDNARPEYPGTRISDGLRMTADVLGADVGVRVVHVPLGGFDTHSDQAGSHGYLMEQFNDTLVAFREDLDHLGLAEDTLIATVSEFGRRPDQNGNGTDHGAASVAMLMGPVNAGLHGEHPSLAKLDDDDNLRATVRMDEYYATLAGWLGIDHRTVLDGNPTPIDDLLLPCV